LPLTRLFPRDLIDQVAAILGQVDVQGRAPRTWQPINTAGQLVIEARSAVPGRLHGRVREPGGLGCGIPAYDRLVILRCTSKLLAVIGPPLAAKPAPEPDAEDWYANLLWFDRRKCLLLTHAGTLFSIFEANVSAPGLRATGPFVSRLIERELACEGLPSALFAGLEPRDLILAKTADRSVLGCMNDMAFLCRYTIAESGGLMRTDLGALNQLLRRNINSARGYQPPIELAARRSRESGR
jgi:hypothetical protein